MVAVTLDHRSRFSVERHDPFSVDPSRQPLCVGRPCSGRSLGQASRTARRDGPPDDRVIGGLYVADTSLFPTGLGVNPMLTVMALARRVARTVQAEG